MADYPIHHLTEASDLYPPLLRETPQPPADLYIRGDIRLLTHTPLLAVVGSRRPTDYSEQCAHRLLAALIASGVPMVSGLAYGIDSLVHRLCVEAQQRTIAVLGCGVDDAAIYPPVHRHLANRILAHGGTLVSEYPPGTAPLPQHFPARNRIIAGLVKAVLIIQAARQSGSLITARHALEANRDVAVVPGPITDPAFDGSNVLIQQGATPALNSADLFHLVGLEPPTRSAGLSATPDQARLLEALPNEPATINVIVARSGLSPAAVATLLTELQLLDAVQQVSGIKYVKK